MEFNEAMAKRHGVPKYRLKFTGLTVAGVGGASGALVRTDGAHVQSLVRFLDDRRAFYEDIAFEYPEQVVASVGEARKFAHSTFDLVESDVAAEIADEVRDACKDFLRNFQPVDKHGNSADLHLLDVQLRALRERVSRYVAFAVIAFDLDVPKNIDFSAFKEKGRAIIATWDD